MNDPSGASLLTVGIGVVSRGDPTALSRTLIGLQTCGSRIDQVVVARDGGAFRGAEPGPLATVHATTYADACITLIGTITCDLVLIVREGVVLANRTVEDVTAQLGRHPNLAALVMRCAAADGPSADLVAEHAPALPGDASASPILCISRRRVDRGAFDCAGRPQQWKTAAARASRAKVSRLHS